MLFGVVFVFTIVFSQAIQKYGVKKVILFGLVFTGISLLVLFFLGWEFMLAVFSLFLVGIGVSALLISTHVTFTDTMIMYCVEGWEVWGKWKGVLIKDLLDKAQVQSDGEYILFECLDGYKTALPTSYLEKYNAMLAYQVNTALLQEHDGFPIRLIAFGKYGYKWAKWVTRLRVMDESQLGYWETLGYPDQAEVPLDRRRYYEGDTIKPLKY